MENLKALNGKIDMLELHMRIFKSLSEDKSRGLLQIKQIQMKFNAIQCSMKKLKELLTENQNVYKEMQEQQLEMQSVLQEVNVFTHIVENSVQNKSDNKENENSFTNHQIQPVINNENTCKSLTETEAYPYSPLEMQVSTPYTRSKLRPCTIVFDVPHLTEIEFDVLPKYMVGRLTLESINKFVDVVNDAVSKKCSIMSKPSSQLKTKEFQLYRNFKVQQFSELRGKQFITEEDIAREYGKTILDKKSHAFLVILRHTKRLIYTKTQGLTLYLISNDISKVLS